MLVQEDILVLRMFAKVFLGVKDHDTSKCFTNNNNDGKYYIYAYYTYIIYVYYIYYKYI